MRNRGTISKFRALGNNPACIDFMMLWSVYHETGNVIETHEHAGEFKEP